MKQVRIVEPGLVEVEDVPPPAPQPGQALVRVLYAGVCGSDVHTYRGVNPLCRYPLVPGHELSARIEQIKGPSDGLGVGDTVVVEPLLRCGGCYPCRQGRYNCCEKLQVMGVHVDGGMREMLALPVELLHGIPADLAPRLAALVEPSTIGWQGVTRGRVSADDTVVVIGAGPIGSLAAVAAKSLGATVGIWEIRADRLARAERLGLDFVIDANAPDAADKTIRELGAPPSVVVEAVGPSHTVRAAIELVRPAGRVVVIGLSPEDVRFAEVLVIRKEIDILGSRNSCRMFPRAIEFVRSHQDILAPLITQEFPLDEAERAIQTMMDTGSDAMKAMVRIGG